MGTIKTQPPAISPVTADLLAALRSFEIAVDHYYCAVSTLRSKNTDWPENGLTREEQRAFNACRALIEDKIRERLLIWANTTNAAAPV